MEGEVRVKVGSGKVGVVGEDKEDTTKILGLGSVSVKETPSE